jgi:uncharacterized membrane protein YccF (DUF307 family)
MRTLLNLLWMILGGGIVIALEYALGALVLCLTIVGIPFGMQCFKLAGLALWPFGKVVDRGHRGVGCLGLGLNILWCVVAGIWIFLSHLALAVGLAVTVIGIPFAIQHLKLAVLSLVPFGAEVREVP